MAADGEEPVGSMGTDTPLAVLSEQAAAPLQLLQAALRPGDQSADRRDPRGAGHLDGHAIGPEPNLLEPTPRVAAAQIKLPTPDPHQRGTGQAATLSTPPAFKALTLLPHASSSLRRRGRGSGRAPWTTLCRTRTRRSLDGANILILSDRGVDREHAPIPALLAVAGLHHH